MYSMHIKSRMNENNCFSIGAGTKCMVVIAESKFFLFLNLNCMLKYRLLLKYAQIRFSSSELKISKELFDHFVSSPLICPSVCSSVNYHTFLFFSKSTGSIQPNSIFKSRGFNVVKNKDYILFQGDIIKNYRKLVSIFKTVLKKKLS